MTWVYLVFWQQSKPSDSDMLQLGSQIPHDHFGVVEVELYLHLHIYLSIYLSILIYSNLI